MRKHQICSTSIYLSENLKKLLQNFTNTFKIAEKGDDDMLRLCIIFFIFVTNTTITQLWTVEGTWENLLLQSMSLSMIIVFLFYYVGFVIAEKKRKQIETLFKKEFFHEKEDFFEKDDKRKVSE